MQTKNSTENLRNSKNIKRRLEAWRLLSPLTYSLNLYLDRKPMKWDRLPWMKVLLNDLTPDVRIRKASQMGVSTAMILWVLWLCETDKANRGIAYWLPTDGDTSDFVRTKVNTLVDQNNETFLPARMANGPDNVGLKFFWNTPTFWRGIKSRSAVKSISADATIFDEFDECEPAQVSQARERMAASDAKLVRELSTPTIPDFGIDKRFQDTDQRFVHFRCSSCSNWVCLEETFPHCILQDRQGDYYRGCPKCSGHLDLDNFQWVQKSYLNKIHGYQISQLYSPWINLKDLMHEFHTTDFPGHFHNHKLGLPYISATDRVTKEQVLELCDPNTDMRHQSQVQTVAGIDVGKVLHVVIMLADQKDRVIWIGEALNFEELDKIFQRFAVKACVIDAMPEQHEVRKLIDRFPRKVWACWYSDTQKDKPVWDDESFKVSVNRTETLDVGTTQIHERRLILPKRSPVVEEFAQHCANIVKVVETDDETGDKFHSYRRIGPDHYRHSLNYAKIAAMKFRHGAASSWRT